MPTYNIEVVKIIGSDTEIVQHLNVVGGRSDCFERIGSILEDDIPKHEATLGKEGYVFISVAHDEDGREWNEELVRGDHLNEFDPRSASGWFWDGYDGTFHDAAAVTGNDAPAFA